MTMNVNGNYWWVLPTLMNVNKFFSQRLMSVDSVYQWMQTNESPRQTRDGRTHEERACTTNSRRTRNEQVSYDDEGVTNE